MIIELIKSFGRCKQLIAYDENSFYVQYKDGHSFNIIKSSHCKEIFIIGQFNEKIIKKLEIYDPQELLILDDTGHFKEEGKFEIISENVKDILKIITIIFSN